MDCSPPGSSIPENSPGKNMGMSGQALLRDIFPTQGFNPGLPHYRQILYHLSHQESPRILEWVACPIISRGTSQPRRKTRDSCMQVDSLPAELPRKPHILWENHNPKRHMYLKFTAALFITAKTWKQPKCLSTDEKVKKMYVCDRQTHTMEY